MSRKSNRSTAQGKSHNGPRRGTLAPPLSFDYDRLTPRQRTFLDVYLQKFDGIAAVVAALSLPTDDGWGAEVLRDPAVREALEGVYGRPDEGTDLPPYSLDKLLRHSTEDFIVVDGSPKGWSFDLNTAAARRALPLVESFTINKGKVVSLKLRDAGPALARILRRLG